MTDQTPIAGRTRLRAADLRPGTFDEERRTCEIIWTTGARVQRYSWEEGMVDEELEVSAQAVDMQRLNAGAPVLNSHRSGNLADVIGAIVPGSARIVNGQGLATIQLSDRPDVAPILADVRSGVLRNVSVGYRVQEYQVTRREGERPIYRAVRWEPLEVSLVAIPADAEAQIRNLPGHPPAIPGESNMNAHTQPAQPAPPTISDPTAAERQRAADITALYHRHGLDDRVSQAIADGLSFDQARAAVLDALAASTARLGGREPTFGPARPRDVVQDMLAGLVDPSHNPVQGQRAASIEDCALTYCRMHGINAFTGAEAVRSWHSTSDFALATANVLGNMVARAIPQAEPAIARAARRISRSNYHPGNMLSLSTTSPLQNVNEAGELNAVTVDERGEAMPVPRDLGAIFNITSRALIQDVQGLFDQLTSAMVRAAMEKLRADLLAPLLANSGNGQTMRDTIAMFNAAHNNRAASGGAISVTTLSAARQAMRLQVDSRGQRLAVKPWALLVHPAQETTAQQILQQLAANQVSNVNPFGGTLELIVEPGLTSTTGWYLVADPASYEGLCLATLDGQESPTIQTREAWNTLGVETRIVWALDARFVETATWYFNPGV